MADYPNNYFSPREKENRSGVTYDPSKKTVIFVEDLDVIRDELIAIEQALGLANAKNYQKYVDRGDPATYDFDLSSLITDGAWHDLNLSSIVPAGAKAVHLRVEISDDVPNSVVRFRKNGNTNIHNAGVLKTQVANQEIDKDIIVSCDANRIIEYLATNTTWTGIWIWVRGWFI
jgi:hypothetical protein